MADIFISYSRKDSEFGRKLHTALLGQKRDIWMDWTSIAFGAQWWHEISTGIEGADNFIFLISPSSMSSPVCQLEVEYARRNNKRIVPVLVATIDERIAFVDLVTYKLSEFQEALIGERDLLAIARDNWQTLSGINWVSFENTDFESKLADLTTTLDLDLEHVHNHTKFLLRAKDWQQRTNAPGLLLHSEELLEAEKWLDKSSGLKPEPTDDQRKFIAASRAEQDRQARIAAAQERRTTRLSRISVIAGVLVVVAAIAFVLALSAGLDSRNQANSAGTAVVHAQASLTPIPLTLTPVAITLQAAGRAVATAQNDLNQANIQIATANAAQSIAIAQATSAQADLVRAFGNSNTQQAVVNQLTAIPPTLTPLAATIQAANDQLATAIVAQGLAVNDAATAQGNVREANQSAAAAQLLVTQAGLTLTPVQGTVQAAQAQIAGVQPTLDQANTLVAGVQPTIAAANLQVVNANLLLTPIPLTLTPVQGTIQAGGTQVAQARIALATANAQNSTAQAVAQAQAATGQALVAGFEQTLTPIPLTLTPVQATVQAGGTQVAQAQIALADANVQIATATYAQGIAIAQAATAGSAAGDAQTRVAEVAMTLTPVPLTLTPVGATLQAANALVINANNQVQTAQSDLVRAVGNSQTQIAVVNQLTSIPPTLTPFAATLIAANNQAATAVANNSQIQTESALTLAPIAATLTPVGATLAAGNTQVAQVRADSGTAIANAGVALTPLQATLDEVNGQIATAVAANAVLSVTARDNQLIARARALLASRDGSALSAALLSIRVLRDAPSVDAETALLDALGRNNARVLFDSQLSTLTAADFSPDGHHIVTAGDNTAIIWDVFTGQRLAELDGHRAPITSIHYSADGTMILTSSKDGTAALWSAEDGQRIRSFAGHQGSVNAAAISPDGKYIVTGGDDGRVILWQADREQQLRTFFVANQYANFQRRILDVAFRYDGSGVLASVDLIGNPGDTNLMVSWNTSSGSQNGAYPSASGQVFSTVAVGSSNTYVTTNDSEIATIRDSSGRVSHDLIGHTRAVVSAVFRNKLVLTASADETAILWDADTGDRIQTFAGHGDALTYATISPDERFVLTVGEDGTAVLWDRQPGDSFRSTAVETSNLQQQVLDSDAKAVTLADISPDGHYLAAAAGTQVKVYDLTSGTVLLTLPQPGTSLNTLAFSADGRSLTAVSGSAFASWSIPDGQVRSSNSDSGRVFRGVSLDGNYVAAYSNQPAIVYLYSTQSGQRSRNYPGHSAKISDAAMSPTGLLMISGGDDTTAIVWNTQISAGRVYTLRHTRPLRQTRFSATGAYAFTTDNGGTGYLWDMSNGNLIHQFPRASNVSFSSDDSLMTVDTGSVIEIYNLPLLQTVRSLPTDQSAITFSNDNRLLTTCSGRKCTIWDITTGGSVATFDDSFPPVFNPDSRTYVYRQDGQMLVSTTPSGDVAAQQLKDANQQGIRELNVANTDGAAYSPDGSLIAISASQRVSIYDAQTGRKLHDLDAQTSGSAVITSLQFSPDGQLLIGMKDSKNIAVVWNVQSGVEKLVLNAANNQSGQAPAGAAAFRPDGAMIATGGIRSPSGFYEVLEWNAATGVLVSRLPDHRAAITDVTYSPDGQLIASADAEGVVDIWDASKDSRLLRIQAHQGAANAVAFSPDGSLIVTGGDDDLAVIWDVQTGEKRLTLSAHVAGVTDVAFSSDGKYIVTIGRDSFAYVWDATTGQPVRMPLLHDGVLNSIAFKPDGRQFATTGQMASVRIWDVDYHDFVAYACGQLVRDFTASERERFGLQDDVPACDSHADQTTAATVTPTVTPESTESTDSSLSETPAATPTAAALATGTINATALVRIHDGPSAGAPLVGTVSPNTNVSILAYSEDRAWVQIRLTNGQEGWISAQFIH